MELHDTWRWIIGGILSGCFALIIWRFNVVDANWKEAVAQTRSDFKDAIASQAKFFTESIANDRLFLQTLITGQQAQWEAAVQSLRDTIENSREEIGAMRSRLHAGATEVNAWRTDHIAAEAAKWESRDKSSAEYRERTSTLLAEQAGAIKLLDERTQRLQQDFREKLNKLGSS